VHFRDKEIGMALNMVLNLRKLTFEHFLLLTLDEISCQYVLKAFPKAGVHTSSIHPPAAPSLASRKMGTLRPAAGIASAKLSAG